MNVPEEFKELYKEGIAKIDEIQAERESNLYSFKELIKKEISFPTCSKIEKEITGLTRDEYWLFHQDATTVLSIIIKPIYIGDCIDHVSISYKVTGWRNQKKLIYFTDKESIAIAVFYGAEPPKS